MKRFVLLVALVVPAAVSAQGVKDPSTPNHHVIIVNPSQPSPTTATPNIPSAIQPPVTGVERAVPYHGSGTRTSRSSRYR